MNDFKLKFPKPKIEAKFISTLKIQILKNYVMLQKTLYWLMEDLGG